MRISNNCFFYCLIMLSYISQACADNQNQAIAVIDEKNFEQIVRDHLKLKQYEEAFAVLKKVVETGNAEAQCLLGVLYCNFENNPTLGAKWLEKAAHQGHVDAQLFLGSFYLDGEGLKKDRTKALFWLKKSAEKNSPLAQGTLAREYYLDKNYEEALKWFNKAAEQDETLSQYHLGIMYFAGLGVSKNYQIARKYFEKAAIKGYAAAQLELGTMYAKGEGVPQDYKKSFYWWNKSAAQDLADAQCNLGICYKEGLGVEKSQEKAIYWLSKAIHKKNLKAAQIMYSMYQDGSLPEISMCDQNGSSIPLRDP